MRKLRRFDLDGLKGQEVQGSDLTMMNRMYWRGDSRGPGEIFENGFRRRDDTAESYFKRRKVWSELDADKTKNPHMFQGKALGPETVLSRTGDRNIMAPSLPQFRARENDIAPSTAVCVASSFIAGALFPLLTEGESQFDSTWVYAVQVENGFNTFQMQVQMGKNEKAFNFVQEACCNDIPPMHVIGVIQVERAWRSVTWQAGAKGYVEGSVEEKFRVNPKSIGCVGRTAKIEQAKMEIANTVNGGKFEMKL